MAKGKKQLSHTQDNSVTEEKTPFTIATVKDEISKEKNVRNM